MNGPVLATGSFSSGKNGNVTASLTVDPPPSDISCPNGQRLQLASVSYSNVVLTDTTNGVSIAVGNFASGCLLPDVRGPARAHQQEGCRSGAPPAAVSA